MLSLVLVALAPFQDLAPTSQQAAAPDLGRVTSAAVAIDYREDGFRLLGPGWDTDFEHGRAKVAVTTADRKEVRTALVLELESIGRGGRVERVHSPTPHAVVDQTVERTVYPGVREVWTSGAAGVELSYVFSSRPPGHGDLVVRLAADAGGVKPVPDEGGWLYGEGEGALRVGEVLGIDADGNQAPGEVRASDGWLELVLPATFVDEACYPLVLDPPIGPNQRIAYTMSGDTEPDLVQDPDTGRWMVAFQRKLSSNAYETWVTLLTRYGIQLGFPAYVASSASPMSPVVAGLFAEFGEERFVLGFVNDFSVGAGGYQRILLYSMTTSGPSSLELIWYETRYTSDRLSLDIGAGYWGVALATTVDRGECWLQLLDVDPYGTALHTSFSTLLGTQGTLESPVRVTKTMSGFGWFFIAWGEPTSTGSKIRCAAAMHVIFPGWPPPGLVLAPTDVLADTSASYREPAVATTNDFDGSTFALAYIRDDGTDDLMADRYTVAPGSGVVLTGRKPISSGNSFVHLRYPDIAWTGGGHVITWSAQSWGSSIRAATFDFSTFGLCEPPWTVASGFVGRARVTGAGETPGAWNNELVATEARIAWSNYGIYTLRFDDCD